MANRWLCVMLTVGWLGGLCAQARAQALPAFAPRNAAPPPAALVPGVVPAPAAPIPEPTDFVPAVRQEEPRGPWLQIRTEYLLWGLPRMDLPAIVTTGNFLDTVPAAIGQPGTRFLVNGRIGDDNPHNGMRLYVSIGEDSDPNLSLYGSAFFLQRRYGRATFSGDGANGSEVLARPFFNETERVQDADPISVPNILAGSVLVQTNRQMYGGEAALRWHYWEGGNARIAFIAGPRFLFVEELLLNFVRTRDLPGPGVPGNSYEFNEHYATDNGFYGGQFGVEWQFRLGPCSLSTAGKLAMGPIFQNLNTRASSRVTEGATGQTFTSPDRSLYLFPSAIGNFSRTHFAVVPEVNAKVGLDFTEWIGMSVGYSYVYISDVIRPSEFVNRSVTLQNVGDLSIIPPARTPPSFRTTSFWGQGLEVSLLMRF